MSKELSQEREVMRMHAVPGKIVRELAPEERADLLKNADIYVRRAKIYREQLTGPEL